ncbi:MAG: flagellin [Alphaproteobacteria bacterium]
MVSRVSVIGVLTQNLSVITQSRKQLDRLNYSLATGQNFQELKFYGQDAARIVDLRKDIEARQSYIRSIEVTQSTTSSYDAILESLVEMTSSALSAAEPLSSQDIDFPTTTTVLANNFMLELEANLNIKLGDRFIFAGSNFGTAPVTDLRTLTLYNTTDLVSNGAVANTIETADTLPQHTVDAGGAATVESYLTGFAGAGTIDSNAYARLRVTISDKQPVNYNLRATEPAFQNLVEGLLRLKSAAQAGLTEDEREEFLGDARNALDTARTQLRQLQASNGTILNELERTSQIHKGFITISQTALDDMTVADEAEVAVRISSLQNQLEASFTTIARQSQLTLVNFLR